MKKKGIEKREDVDVDGEEAKRKSHLKHHKGDDDQASKHSNSSGNSAVNLPKNEIQGKISLKNNEFLRLYNMKGGIHDGDRERASSIVQNLQYNDKLTQNHPFFN